MRTVFRFIVFLLVVEAAFFDDTYDHMNRVIIRGFLTRVQSERARWERQGDISESGQ